MLDDRNGRVPAKILASTNDQIINSLLWGLLGTAVTHAHMVRDRKFTLYLNLPLSFNARMRPLGLLILFLLRTDDGECMCVSNVTGKSVPECDSRAPI